MHAKITSKVSEEIAQDIFRKSENRQNSLIFIKVVLFAIRAIHVVINCDIKLTSNSKAFI
jgi:hypothetical protein